MEISDYLTLLNSLRDSGLGIWANFLTVSLAIVAFVGSVKSLDIRGIVLLSVLFAVFSYTNYTGLKKNFELRQEVVATINKIKQSDFQSESSWKEFKSDRRSNSALISKYSSEKKWSEEKLIFHNFVSALVPLLIFSYYVLGIWLTRRSNGTAKIVASPQSGPLA
ncbi:hypothetical protein [Colwellia sp. PAMC 21821]|uniref:hypothetical protein n=1 Tax=Colwellia sp. PAMC 21821 TaxID=1816219 RepID=UPI0009BDFFAB|nr:hypothetical protein [Colwellia sp. PAMC 21821]ARD43529.1 hypothetical protein A3Q33_03935 [Colwellia sp. PAMC 21821]